MKKRVLKNWVVNVLIALNFIALLFMGSDWEDLKMFILINGTSLLVFTLNVFLIAKYSSKEVKRCLN